MSNFPLLLTFLLLPASQAADHSRRVCSHNYCEIQNFLFSWIEDNGGYINPKLELSTGPDENWTIRGIFATSDIKEGEMIFSIPPVVQLCHPDTCGLIQLMRDELKKGERSFYWPYILSMEDHRVDLPAFWNEHERSLFAGIQPKEWQSQLRWYETVCGGDVNDVEHVRAMMLVLARHQGNEYAVCMSPIYDALNHGSYAITNTAYRFHETNFQRYASRPISTGEQVWNHFGNFTVARFFQEYGFIPQYPRIWSFTGSDGFTYAIELHDDNGFLKVDPNPLLYPHQLSLHHLYGQIKLILEEADSTPVPVYNLDDMLVDPWRHNMALEYRAEYIRAMKVTLQAIESHLESEETL